MPRLELVPCPPAAANTRESSRRLRSDNRAPHKCDSHNVASLHAVLEGQRLRPLVPDPCGQPSKWADGSAGDWAAGALPQPWQRAEHPGQGSPPGSCSTLAGRSAAPSPSARPCTVAPTQPPVSPSLQVQNLATVNKAETNHCSPSAKLCTSSERSPRAKVKGRRASSWPWASLVSKGHEAPLFSTRQAEGNYRLGRSQGRGCVVIPGNVILILSHKSACQEPKQPGHSRAARCGRSLGRPHTARPAHRPTVPSRRPGVRATQLGTQRTRKARAALEREVGAHRPAWAELRRLSCPVLSFLLLILGDMCFLASDLSGLPGTSPGASPRAARASSLRVPLGSSPGSAGTQASAVVPGFGYKSRDRNKDCAKRGSSGAGRLVGLLRDKNK